MGFVHVYTGDGKGKTTAALGLALRAVGNGLRVIMYQFLKERECGEHRVRISGFKIVRVKNFDPNEILKSMQEHDIVILDEIFNAINKGIVKLDELLYIIMNRPKNVELILTGRNAPKEIIDVADLVTEMKKIKHYYDIGVKARKGIEC